MSKFAAASRGFPCDSMAFLLGILLRIILVCGGASVYIVFMSLYLLTAAVLSFLSEDEHFLRIFGWTFGGI